MWKHSPASFNSVREGVARQLSFLGSFMGSLAELKQVAPLLENGTFNKN